MGPVLDRFGSLALIAFLAVGFLPLSLSAQFSGEAGMSGRADVLGESSGTVPVLVAERTAARLDADLAALQTFRPGYPFWRHVFMIPDGSIAFGSAIGGELLAVFPARGDWNGGARWERLELAAVLDGQRLETGLTQRRDQVAQMLESEVGPVVHNATRGRFLLPNARRYGSFIAAWSEIYERFGVPADIGLAQAILESGLNGRVRSEAGALGFCQWMPGNWNKLKRLSPHEIEGYNQTTQAPFCAAYLSILATKYGSFIPALSEHHAGGTNVGRTLINGGRLGGQEVREQYLLGSEFARDVRMISLPRYRDVVRTYGPRSFLYAEMVFGNTYTVQMLRDEMPQEEIRAMRTSRSISLDEITRRTGLSADEVRRFNPALVRQVPRNATLYLPRQIDDFGKDVAFWHRPPSLEYLGVLSDFLAVDASPEQWEEPAFEGVLREFQRRFRATETEEGVVMATVLAYVMEETRTSGRREILADFRSSREIESLFHLGVLEREASRSTSWSER